MKKVCILFFLFIASCVSSQTVATASTETTRAKLLEAKIINDIVPGLPAGAKVIQYAYVCNANGQIKASDVQGDMVGDTLRSFFRNLDLRKKLYVDVKYRRPDKGQTIFVHAVGILVKE